MREIIDTTSTASVLEGRALYEADEQAWLDRQIKALKSGRLDSLDRDTLAEFLTEMTRSDRRELRSRLTVLVMHMLKVTYQPTMISQSWINTIRVQQREINDIIEDTPSLRQQVESLLAASYPRAVEDAVGETGLNASVFPPECPWSADQALGFQAPAPPAPSHRRGRE